MVVISNYCKQDKKGLVGRKKK